MDSKEIRELIKLISESTVSKFEMERDGLKIKVVKQPPTATATSMPTVSVAPAAGAPIAVPPPVSPAPADAGASTAVNDGGVDLKAPIVGTFFRSPGPDSPVFVDVGSRVTKGQVLCIIEAMKVMNEIESETDAEILEILVADGQPVEYGETIFRMRPL